MPQRPEARLTKQILLELGKDPEIGLYTNPVGEGFRGSIQPQIRRILHGSSLKDAVLQVLYCHRVVYGLGVGSPDLVAIGRGGRFCGLELKAGSSPSPAQLQWHAAARSRGAHVEVVESIEQAWGVVG